MPKIPFKIDGDTVSREFFRQMFTNSEVPCPLMTRPTSIWIGGQQIPVTHEAISPCVILWPSSQVGMTLLLKFSELKNTSKIQLVGRGSDGKRCQWYDMHKLGQNPGDECEKTLAHDLDMLNWTSSGWMMVGFEPSYVGFQAILFPRSSESVILYSVTWLYTFLATYNLLEPWRRHAFSTIREVLRSSSKFCWCMYYVLIPLMIASSYNACNEATPRILGSSSAVPIQSFCWLLELCCWDWKLKKWKFSRIHQFFHENISKFHVELEFTSRKNKTDGLANSQKFNGSFTKGLPWFSSMRDKHQSTFQMEKIDPTGWDRFVFGGPSQIFTQPPFAVPIINHWSSIKKILEFKLSWILGCQSLSIDFGEEVFISLVPITCIALLHPPRLKPYTMLPITPLHQDGWEEKRLCPTNLFDVSTRRFVTTFVVMETQLLKLE